MPNLVRTKHNIHCGKERPFAGSVLAQHQEVGQFWF